MAEERKEWGAIDPLSKWIGIRWEARDRVRMAIRDELLNPAGLLAGPVAYALIDYCMGSALWAERQKGERIATISISINYVQTATESELVCTTELDRRNRSNAVLSSEVRHVDGRLIATAIGSYSIFERANRGGVRIPAPEQE